MYWSKITLYNNGENNNTLPCQYFLIDMQFLGFYIKNSNKKPVLDNYKADIYWNKISTKKIGHHARSFSVQYLNQL